MTWYDEITWCDGCGVEITWGPYWLIDAPTAAVNAPSSMRSSAALGQPPLPPIAVK
jgi:hypothetical protein